MAAALITGNGGYAVLQKSVRDTEKHMSVLQRNIGGLMRNQERIRRKGLKTALALKQFSESEGPQLAAVLSDVADLLAEVESARQVSMAKIEMTREPLKYYKALCSRLRDEIRMRDTAVMKEMRKQEQLDRLLLQDAANRGKITQGQMALSGANHGAASVTETLLGHVHTFESQKRRDLKVAIGQLIREQMNFYAQSLEILTEAHQLLMTTDLDGDLEEIAHLSSSPRSASPSPTRKSRGRSQRSARSAEGAPSPSHGGHGHGHSAKSPRRHSRPSIDHIR
ncbi:FAM92 protein-domain-containing protein [Phlyctochytrium arcticum]|nr:FAM92 protein-domain-containing protein [Phlyctochytrium arcticum]